MVRLTYSGPRRPGPGAGTGAFTLAQSVNQRRTQQNRCVCNVRCRRHRQNWIFHLMCSTDFEIMRTKASCGTRCAWKPISCISLVGPGPGEAGPATARPSQAGRAGPGRGLAKPGRTTPAAGRDRPAWPARSRAGHDNIQSATNVSLGFAASPTIHGHGFFCASLLYLQVVR